MRAHIGAVLTSGLSALALCLALLQALVLAAQGPSRAARISAEVPVTPAARWSAPGGRSSVPYRWGDPARPPEQPGTQQKHEEQRHAPPRSRGALPEMGPRPPRRLAA